MRRRGQGGVVAPGSQACLVRTPFPNLERETLEINAFPKGPSHLNSRVHLEHEESQMAINTRSNLNSPRVAKGIISTSVKMPGEWGRTWASDPHTATILGGTTGWQEHRARAGERQCCPEWAGHRGTNQTDLSSPQPSESCITRVNTASEGPAELLNPPGMEGA